MNAAETGDPGPGIRRFQFDSARSVLERAIAQRAFPAAVIEVGRAGQILWRQSFGTLTFEPGARAATDETIFDLASLTKVLVTTPLVMIVAGVRLARRMITGGFFTAFTLKTAHILPKKQNAAA